MSSVYYLNLMYGGLRTSDTIHKKSCRTGPGIYATSENVGYAKFGESTFHATRVNSPSSDAPGLVGWHHTCKA